jgi:hypothetical protein
MRLFLSKFYVGYSLAFTGVTRLNRVKIVYIFGYAIKKNKKLKYSQFLANTTK